MNIENTLPHATLMDNWYVYMVRCADDSLYTGVAKNIQRRVEEHNNNDVLGAKYTRARRPVELVYEEACSSRSAACKREYEIKQFDKDAKENLILR